MAKYDLKRIGFTWKSITKRLWGQKCQTELEEEKNPDKLTYKKSRVPILVFFHG